MPRRRPVSPLSVGLFGILIVLATLFVGIIIGQSMSTQLLTRASAPQRNAERFDIIRINGEDVLRFPNGSRGVRLVVDPHDRLDNLLITLDTSGAGGTRQYAAELRGIYRGIIASGSVSAGSGEATITIGLPPLERVLQNAKPSLEKESGAMVYAFRLRVERRESGEVLRTAQQTRETIDVRIVIPRTTPEVSW